MKNPFLLPGRWYKANLHTHTTASDGVVSPAERVRQYRRAGYHVLALTDHRKTNDCRQLDGRGMLLISGIECHPLCPSAGVPLHLVGLHVPHGFAPSCPDDANRTIADIRSAGGEVILAHPAWCCQGYDDFRDLRHLAAVEVYNATCARHGRASSESEWDIALHHEMSLPCIGVDDCHCADGEDVFESWTWLRMPSLGVRQVLRALRTGACYASCGPRIHDFRLADGQVRLRCSPAQEVTFIGGPGQGARRRAEPGQTLRGFRIARPGWKHVRARVTDSRGRCAWTNPLRLT